jgi:hypothetical protein
MSKRIQKLLVAVGALAALSLGGAVFAQAQSAPPAAPETTSAPDTDTVQSGDQTTPDTAKAAAAPHARYHAVLAPSSTTAGPSAGGSDQSGDQTTPDQPGSGTEKTGAEKPESTGAEKPESGAGSESATPNDGPGGYADPPGNSTADHQFQGNE